MIELTIHDLLLCPHHGHPILVLRRRGHEEYLAVAMSPEDAQAMAIAPTAAVAGRVRLFGMMEAAIAGLGAHLTGVELHFGHDAILHASIRIEGRHGAVTLPAYFADGIILARRRFIPLRMAEEDFSRVRLQKSGRPEHRPQPQHQVVPDRRQLGPFGPFIESLDLDGIGLAGPAVSEEQPDP